MSEQNIMVDEIETNLININKKRNQRREQKNQEMVEMFREIHERKKREKYLETLKLASIIQAEGDDISPDIMEGYRSGLAPVIKSRESADPKGADDVDVEEDMEIQG